MYFIDILQCFDDVGWASKKSNRPVKTEWWGAGMVTCLEEGANDLHIAQLMPMPPHCHLLH